MGSGDAEAASSVVADAGHGDNPLFLDGLEVRHECYTVDVRIDFQVSSARATYAEVLRAENLVARLRPNAWRVIRWREGIDGWLKGSFAVVRC